MNCILQQIIQKKVAKKNAIKLKVLQRYIRIKFRINISIEALRFRVNSYGLSEVVI